MRQVICRGLGSLAGFNPLKPGFLEDFLQGWARRERGFFRLRLLGNGFRCCLGSCCRGGILSVVGARGIWRWCLLSYLLRCLLLCLRWRFLSYFFSLLFRLFFRLPCIRLLLRTGSACLLVACGLGLRIATATGATTAAAVAATAGFFFMRICRGGASIGAACCRCVARVVLCASCVALLCAALALFLLTTAAAATASAPTAAATTSGAGTAFLLSIVAIGTTAVIGAALLLATAPTAVAFAGGLLSVAASATL